MIYNLEKTLEEEFEKRELQGELEGKLDVARKLLQEGFFPEEVTELTELSLEQVIEIVQ